ncbi:MAG: POTRA domain-containing protein [Candidatus Acidiferrales bacterium]
MRSHFAKLLFSLLILFLAAASHAQQQASGPAQTSKLAEITVTGTQKFPAEQIATASGLKPGDAVTAQQIQDAANRLAALGIFSTINFRYTTKGDGIALNFQVKEAPSYPISFDNFPWFTDQELADAIRGEVGLFSGEAPDSGALIDEMTIVLENLLASKKLKGSVTHQLLAQAIGDGMTMQFRVEGPALRIQSVQFGDSLATASERLKDRIPDLKGQPYSRFAVEVFENEHVRPLYANKGFLRAQIGPPQAHLTVDLDNPAMPGVDVLIPVTPGPAYSWKGASWQGNTAFATTVLDGAFGLKPGDVADGMKIEAEWQRIESEYRRHGYLDVKLNPQQEFDDANRQVSYRVEIAEGSQYRMGDMVITGLSLDAEKRLRRVWQLAAGQVFDNGYYDNMTKELQKPTAAVFGEIPIHYNEFGHFLRPNTDRHTVDVLLDFK